MADEVSKAEVKSISLSRDDIVSYFKKKGTKEKCPICDYAGWFVFTQEDKQIVSLEYTDQKAFLPSVVLVCKNCNFIRLHAKLLIEDDIRTSNDARKPDGA